MTHHPGDIAVQAVTYNNNPGSLTWVFVVILIVFLCFIYWYVKKIKNVR